jgi:hypothetical protein
MSVSESNSEALLGCQLTCCESMTQFRDKTLDILKRESPRPRVFLNHNIGLVFSRLPGALSVTWGIQ